MGKSVLLRGQPQSGGPYACVQTDNQGKCFYPPIDYITGADEIPYTNNNIWNPQAGFTQTLYSASPRDWYVQANAGAVDGAVLCFPNVGWLQSGRVDARSSIKSSWVVDFQHDDDTITAWACYDLWFNEWADEVMIQVDISANIYYHGTTVASATFGGMPWHMQQYGSERVWKPGVDDDTLMNMPAGSLEIQEFLTWMMANGHLPVNSVWKAASFGFEVCQTSGQTIKMACRDFTWRPS